MKLKNTRTFSIAIVGTVLLATGCVATYTPEQLRDLPDSYFTSRYGYMTRDESNEWQRRQYEKTRELDREAACVFGSRPAIDRKKLHCENVKGSPEYKALYGS